MFTDSEKKFLRILVENEIKAVEDEESTIRPDFPDIIKAEEDYESFLNKILKKLK